MRVELRRRPDEVVAAVADDGLGFDVEDVMRSRERGLGLFGMQERLALVSGQLSIDSRPGGARASKPACRAWPAWPARLA